MDETLPRSRAEAALLQNYSLFTVACVLSGDPARAEALVREALDSGQVVLEDRPVIALDIARMFAQRVYQGWRRYEASAPPKRTSSSGGFAALTREQRAAVALCAYGAHTYRMAAGVLGTTVQAVTEQVRIAVDVLDLELRSGDSILVSEANEDLTRLSPAGRRVGSGGPARG